MIKIPSINILRIKLMWLLLLTSAICYSQNDIRVKILGGADITNGGSVSMVAGNSINFRITGNLSNCGNIRVENITLGNTTDFTLSSDNLPQNIKSEQCNNGNKKIDFTITNISGNCGANTAINIEVRNDPTFIFTFNLSGAPKMNVLGGSPSADILNGATTTSAVNGTYFGVVDEGASVTRSYVIANTGSCKLDITGLSSTPVSGSGFSVWPGILVPPSYNWPGQFSTVSVNPGSYVVILVTFIGPTGGTGTQKATINISNNANTTFSFDVSAEMFNYNIPGPGGITADFRLWLKSTRGVTKDLVFNKVSKWSDIGTNGKHATQTTFSNRPTFKDDAASNINFNPVLKFENDGSGLEQFLYNNDNGFYSQDMFIVMVPDATMTSASNRNTIFSGIASGSAGDITGIGFGNYSSRFTNETLSYNQNIPSPSGSYNGKAEISSSYSKAGIINVRNNVTLTNGEDILYNSNVLSTTAVNDVTYANVGYVDGGGNILGTKYWIGRNLDIQGSLNGRVAEIFTFASRLNDTDRQKIESYLAIKYGITLGSSTQAQKDYINSFDTKVWDITTNVGYNYHVAGIGKDYNSDLNQKQSKTLNTANDVTIGLNGVFTKNSSNTNEFKKDGDFLVWGNNDAAYTASGSNTITIASGITTSVTRILRQWKIVESKEDVDGDVENVYISIPSGAFSGFALGANEEYALIVADNDAFTDTDIIDVIPLKPDGAGNLLTWYDFDGIKYFTFGKVSKLSENHSISIASGDYLVGEYAINLNINAFTISAWVKADPIQTSTRTIMSKGSKLQLRLNSSHEIEVMVDNDTTPKFTSTMALTDNKWHQITFVYNSGSIFLYVDGVLDKSEQDVVAPTPNYNRFSIGALYIDKNTINNPFLGEIDEVYVWDQGLNEEQIRYLMNQEIEKGTDTYVWGKVLPHGAANNEVCTILWSKLKAYYNFNSFYGSTVEGQSDGRNFLRLNYLNTDKTLIKNQTIPAPYISAGAGAWDTGTTWSNYADQIIPNSLSLDGTTIIDWNIVQISHDITSGNRDISLLGLIQTGGNLTMDGVTDMNSGTGTGQGLSISNYLELDGVIKLNGESQLIQLDGSILDEDSGGYIEQNQQGTANAFNYNYWSSSVGPIRGNISGRGNGISSTNASAKIGEVLFDGTSLNPYQPLNFKPSAYAADSNTPSNPKTISTYWLYTFYGADGDYYAWKSINQNTALLPGEGWTMKGTSGSVALATNQNYVFKGRPYNGDFTLPLDKAYQTPGEKNRLVGNPYPSAMDATEFILDNLSVADGGNNTTTVINGALYYWNHFGQTDSHYLKDYVGGYATYNLIGGTVAITQDWSTYAKSAVGPPPPALKMPGPYIPINQGFFVSTAIEGFEDGNGVVLGSVAGGNIVFKNSQRLFIKESPTTSVFMKNSKSKATNETSNLNSTPRISLLYHSPEGFRRQLVIGTNKNASNGFEVGYDAFMADVNKEDMYWTIGDAKFVIQGVHDFNDNQEFPLGLIVKKAGIIKIKIDKLEHIDTNKKLYIKDSLTEETFEINNAPFETFLEPGTYKDRFKLVFQSTKALSITDVELTNKVSVIFKTEISSLEIYLNDATYVSGGTVINLMGQKITTIEAFEKHISVPIHVSTGAYIIQLNTEKGLINKKIIIN